MKKPNATCGASFLGLLLAGAGVLGAGCATDAPHEPVQVVSAPILGGTLATNGQFPTVVAILVNQGQNGLCTGTLIAPEWVLTAAHCVNPTILQMGSQAQVTAATTVKFGTTSAFSGGNTVSAAATIYHPAFNLNTLANDIGLVKLSTPQTITPTAINRKAADAPAGSTVTMVGFGQSTGSQASAGTEFWLTKATADCSTVSYGPGFPITPDNALLFCYPQTDGKGKCHGDSGGPSFLTIGGMEKVVGITSFGDQNCVYAGADTRVDAQLDFIDTNIPELKCASDGACGDGCGAGGLPEDPDCPTCSKDSECGDDKVCDDGHCVPAPLSPTGLGSLCTGAQDCFSGLCAAGPDGMRCTETCTVGGSDCPGGFDCLSAGDTGACWPGDDPSGDCSVAGVGERPRGDGGGALALVSLLAGLGVVLVRGARRLGRR